MELHSEPDGEGVVNRLTSSVPWRGLMPSRPLPLLDYVVAVTAVSVAAAIRGWLDPLLGEQAPFATFLLAVLFATWYGGRGLGLVALALSIPVGTYLFI